jgi:hypothetical protein
MASSQSLFTSDQLESTTLVVSAKKQKIETKPTTSSHSHNPDAASECMPVFFTGERISVPELILSYLDGDIDSGLEERESKQVSVEERQQLTFFGKNFFELMAVRVANLVLLGDEKSVEEALTIVKKNPSLINYIVITKDQDGNVVNGTPLQIAAMAGDVNLTEVIPQEKDKGMVERLALASGLSEEEVAKQLHVVTSKEAEQENEKRKQHILKAIIDFGNGILDVMTDNDIILEGLQKLCQPIIEQLEASLKPDPNVIITSGYIFDPRILSEAAKWFKENINRFGGYHSIRSEVLCINGFAKLQKKFSARDFQIITAGIGKLVDNRVIPPRASRDAKLNSRLGVRVYIGFSGVAMRDAAMTDFIARMVPQRVGWLEEAWVGLEKLMSNKSMSIVKLTASSQLTAHL